MEISCTIPDAVVFLFTFTEMLSGLMEAYTEWTEGENTICAELLSETIRGQLEVSSKRKKSKVATPESCSSQLNVIFF